ncbi:MAG TPA: hypothetical protein VK789_35055 [Bryobacteraceae bacterium]|nr:hypothetical protein [Bryobacteraceae bacterium]
MKRPLSFFAIAALTAVSAAPSHAAAIYTVNFTGTVYQTQGATGVSVGNTVRGHFNLDGSTGNFLDFTIAGQSAAPGFLSSVSIGPALYDAIYSAQVSPVALGTPGNNSFFVDLSSLATWPSTDTAYTLLSDTSQLPTNLDTANNPLSMFPSTFGYYTASANGTDVVALSANLTSVRVEATPEPPNFPVATGLCISFPATLAAPAGPGGVFLTLTSSDPSMVTFENGINPLLVFFPAGATSPQGRTPQVCGVNFGTVTVSASGGTLSSGQTVSVEVTDTLDFFPASFTMMASTQQGRLTLTLSGLAPAGGLTVNLSSDNPGVATVPATVTIPANATSVIVPVTGVAPGSTQIQASNLPNVLFATASLTVQ